VVVIDAALLLFWKMDREVDLVLVIHSSRRSRIQRMKQRGISEVDTIAREKAQLPYAEFRRRADRLMLNNGSVEELERKLKNFWRREVSGRTS
jgi:dephospho-CoA kinase